MHEIYTYPEHSPYTLILGQAPSRRACCQKNGRILLANLLQGSSSTFSGARFPRFLAFKEGMLDRQISTLGGSPTVSGR